MVGRMEEAASRSDLVAWPAGLLVAGAVGLALLWLGLRVLPRKSRTTNFAFAFAGAALASGAFWFLLQLAARWVHFSTTWPLSGVATAGGIALESLALAYRHESRMAGPFSGRLVFSLRALALAGILALLLEPVIVSESTREIRRSLAIFVDDSGSMEIVDKNHTATELLDLASALDPESAERSGSLSGITVRARALERLLEQLRAGLLPGAVSTDNPAKFRGAGEFADVQRELRKLETTRGELTESLRSLRRSVKRGEMKEAAEFIDDIRNRFENSLAGDVREATKALDERNAEKAARSLESAVRRLREIIVAAAPHISALDQHELARLPGPRLEELRASTARSRLAVANHVLHSTTGKERSLVEELAENYNLRFFRVAADASETDSGPLPARPASSGNLTDLAQVFEVARSKFASDDLAGVLVASDGRHTAEASVEESARSLGLEGVPAAALAIGSRRGPRDAAITAVRAPESVFEDDVAEIRADLSIVGMEGETVSAFLYADGKPVAEKSVEITSDDYRDTLTFSQKPEGLGVTDYGIKIHNVEDDTFASNNAASFAIAASDDRTNVLLLDGYPRWEFRYLRNLFYARDQSVHLQYVLFRPDRIAGAPPAEEVPASASRPFAEAEANALPESREEWLKFDAIIVGDVPREALDEEAWGSIRAAVADRGALLVLVAGPRTMPHGFESENLADLLPVIPDAFFSDPFVPPEPAFRLRLTAEGVRHSIPRLAADPELNERIWEGLPLLRWRFPSGEIKTAAEVLAYAEPAGGVDLSGDIEGQRANALIVSHRFALGRVVLFNFDRTWRLRYGIGDVLHHRFWGNVLRWGGAENLRSGSEFVRLGTGRLRYEPGEPVRITSRFRLADAPQEVRATVSRGGEPVASAVLRPRADSPWLFDGSVGGLETPGEYTVAIDSPEGPVTTEFRVVERRDDAELRDVTLNLSLLEQISAATGGMTVAPHRAHEVIAAFKPPVKPIRERRERTVWDNGFVLLLLAGLLTAEWIVRRRKGLV